VANDLIRAVLIDLGDTLVHLALPWDDVFQDNLQSLYSYLHGEGLNSAFDEFSKVFIRGFESASTVSHFYKIEIPIQDIVTKTLRKSKFPVPDLTFVEKAVVQFYRPEVDAWEPYPDTIETLSAFKAAGYDLGLISNSKSDWAVHAILDRHGLRKFFKVIVTSAAMRKRKPRPDLFAEALGKLGVKPSETVFIGDSLQADILGARTVGIRSIHVLRKPPEHALLVAPEATVSSLAEAHGQIAKWNTPPSSLT
jgi:putative hydrolase of the HAD superfamily